MQSHTELNTNKTKTPEELDGSDLYDLLMTSEDETENIERKNSTQSPTPTKQVTGETSANPMMTTNPSMLFPIFPPNTTILTTSILVNANEKRELVTAIQSYIKPLIDKQTQLHHSIQSEDKVELTNEIMDMICRKKENPELKQLLENPQSIAMLATEKLNQLAPDVEEWDRAQICFKRSNH